MVKLSISALLERAADEIFSSENVKTKQGLSPEMNVSNESQQVLYQKVHPVVYNTIGIVMTVLFVLALFENIAVLAVYGSSRKLQNKTNLWIVSVIICDLLIVLNAFPFVIIASFAQEYIFGEAGCKWDGFIVTLLGTSSIFLLTGLSVHRYLIMCHQPRSNYSGSRVICSIGFCFILGLLWAVSPLIGWGSFSLEGIGISCAPDWRSQAVLDLSYTIAMYVCVLFIPLLLIGYCYLRILMKIWLEKRNHSSWLKQRGVKRDIKVTISVALTIVSFLVSWMPYAVVSLLESFFNIDLLSISPFLVQLPCLMAKTACIWNPLVYVCHNHQFRTAFLRKFSILQRFSERHSKGNENDTSESAGKVIQLHVSTVQGKGLVTHL